MKTRLEPLLGPDGCAALQARADRRRRPRGLPRWRPGGAYLAYGPGAGEDELRPPGAPAACGCFADGAGDLGDRLAQPPRSCSAERPEPLLVVGTDMPLLTRAHAREAEAVLRERADVCFGPALDGGYWLVGLSRPCAAVFDLGGLGRPAVL